MKNDISSYHVFISYANEDKAIVQEIYRHLDHLKETGITFFIDTEMTASLVGKSKSDFFYSHIHKSKLALLFISNSYIRKENTIYECTIAHDYYKKTGGRFALLPISLDGTISSILSSDLLYLNFQKFDFTNFLEKLKNTIVKNLSATVNPLDLLFEDLNSAFASHFSNEYQVAVRTFWGEKSARYDISNNVLKRNLYVIIEKRENKISIIFNKFISGFNDSEISLICSDIEGQFIIISPLFPELLINNDSYNIEQCINYTFKLITKRFKQDW